MGSWSRSPITPNGTFPPTSIPNWGGTCPRSPPLLGMPLAVIHLLINYTPGVVYLTLNDIGPLTLLLLFLSGTSQKIPMIFFASE